MQQETQKKKFHWKKGLVIFLIIMAIILALSFLFRGDGSQKIKDNTVTVHPSETLSLSSAYVGILPIEGTISDSDASTLLQSSSYHQKWLMNCVEDMKKDENNKGIILYVNTPGGSVYATDELYLKLEEYKEKTGRPIYTYMASEAASGGYYLSMSSSKIYANRNCWTGSIGVTIGTIYDLSGMLEKLGVKTVTITSGRNKSMGSSVEPMTQEQREILQSIVDESYDQFVDVVVKGRKMPKKTVRKLADGRIYTAKQAKDLGLVDEIGALSELESAMKKDEKLGEVDFVSIVYGDETSLVDRVLSSAISKTLSMTSKQDSEYLQMKQLLEENQTFTITYMANIHK